MSDPLELANLGRDSDSPATCSLDHEDFNVRQRYAQTRFQLELIVEGQMSIGDQLHRCRRAGGPIMPGNF